MESSSWMSEVRCEKYKHTDSEVAWYYIQILNFRVVFFDLVSFSLIPGPSRYMMLLSFPPDFTYYLTCKTGYFLSFPHSRFDSIATINSMSA